MLVIAKLMQHKYNAPAQAPPAANSDRRDPPAASMPHACLQRRCRGSFLISDNKSVYLADLQLQTTTRFAHTEAAEISDNAPTSRLVSDS